LGDANPEKRKQAIKNHYKWVNAAKFLGCHSIRVNAASSGTYEEQLERAAEGLAGLTEYGDSQGINVIVENHGGLSSNGEWLSGVMKLVNKPNCGTLPDFGNFHDYDRYRGVEELLPFAKGVSAKSHEFDADGNEVQVPLTDYSGRGMDPQTRERLKGEILQRAIDNGEVQPPFSPLPERPRTTFQQSSMVDEMFADPTGQLPLLYANDQLPTYKAGSKNADALIEELRLRFEYKALDDAAQQAQRPLFDPFQTAGRMATWGVPQDAIAQAMGGLSELSGAAGEPV
jgi:hypothetical protein